MVSPLGVGIAQHWDAVSAGRSAVGRVGRLAALGLPASTGAAVSAELLQQHLGRLPRKRQKLYNRATLLGMLGASLAMEDAGLAGAIAWRDVEVTRDPAGAPGLVFRGALGEALGRAGLRRSSVSLSHTDTYAIAVVVLLEG